MDADPQPPQPDFGQAAQSLHAVAIQLERCQNLPAVDGGAQLVQSMQTLLGRFAAMQRDSQDQVAEMRRDSQEQFAETRRDFQDQVAEMRRDFQEQFAEMRRDSQEQFAEMRRDFQERFDALDAKLERRAKVTDLNTMARAENSTAIQDGSPLVKLYSIVTGQEIVGCPSTVAEVKGLHTRDAERLLRDLGLAVHGNVAAKRRRLLIAFGVATQAV